MKHDHRSRRPLGRDDAAAIHQRADGVVVNGPQRITGGGQVMRGLNHTQLVTAGDEHQRAVEFVDLVQKYRHVHRARFGHLVIIHPRAVILMPLPHIAIEGHFAVDLELVHV